MSLDNLDQFTGSENHYKHPSGLLYTDGIRYVAEEGGAYWLIDAVASYQTRLCRSARLADFQLWELTVKDKRAMLSCRDDEGERAAVHQVIEHTDFPLGYLKFYVEQGVMLLTSEH